MLKPGDIAPDFTAKDQNGKTHSLRDYRGKTVVLWFFPKADTPGCTKEGCAFRDLREQFIEKNAVVIGASFDTPEENKAFAAKFGYPFPILCDVDRKVGIAYGAAADTTVSNAARIGVVIDAQGRVKEWLGKVSAADYPKEVLARL
jgi:peroxiredoxin Q/BCP